MVSLCLGGDCCGSPIFYEAKGAVLVQEGMGQNNGELIA
jgi:hypothetical protein